MKQFLIGVGVGTSLGWLFSDRIDTKLRQFVDYAHNSLDDLEEQKKEHPIQPDGSEAS